MTSVLPGDGKQQLCSCEQACTCCNVCWGQGCVCACVCEEVVSMCVCVGEVLARVCVCACLWSVNYYYNTFFDGLVLELFF